MGAPAVWGGAAGVIARHELAAIVWGLLGLGALAGVLPRVSPPRESRLFVLAVASLAALTALAIAWTSSSEATVEELARVSGYGGIIALGLVTIDRRIWTSVAAGIAVAGPAICALALFARLFPSELHDPAAALAGGRLAYPFGYWNALAAWSAMSAAIALAWSADSRRAVRSLALGSLPLIGLCLYLTYSRGGVVATAFGVAVVYALSQHRARVVRHAVVAALLAGAVIVVARTQPEIAHGTGGDGGWLVLVLLLAGCGAAALLPRWRDDPRRRTRARSGRSGRTTFPSRPARAVVVGVVAFAILVPAVYAAAGGAEPVAASTSGDPATRVLSLDGNRPLYWKEALRAFVSAPAGGIGPGTFGFWWSRAGDATEQVRDAHSLYLEQLAELGPAGLLACVALALGAVGLALVPARRRQMSPATAAMPAAVAVWAAYAAIDWMWESTAVTVLALACALAAAGAGARRLRGFGAIPARRRPIEGASYPRRSLLLRPASLVAVSLLGIVIQVPGLVSTARIQSSRSALEAGLDGRAVGLASDAIEAAPWAASPYEQRALAEEARGRSRAALDDAVEAADRESLNYRRWLVVAELRARQGDRGAARAAYRRARSLAPAAPFFSDPTGRDLRRGIERIPAASLRCSGGRCAKL